MFWAFDRAVVGPDDSFGERIVRVATSITYRVKGVADSHYSDSVSFNIKALHLTRCKII
jgi:hypothetical protein